MCGQFYEQAKDFHYLLRDVAKFSNNQAKILDYEDDLSEFTLEIKPNDGPYKRGKFIFKINPNENPSCSPNVFCLSNIYHPNINGLDNGGDICLSLFDEWSSVNDLHDCVQGLLFLFHEPNLADPLSPYFDPEDVEQIERFEKDVQLSLEGETLDGVEFERNIVNDDDDDGQHDDEEKLKDDVNNTENASETADATEEVKNSKDKSEPDEKADVNKTDNDKIVDEDTAHYDEHIGADDNKYVSTARIDRRTVDVDTNVKENTEVKVNEIDRTTTESKETENQEQVAGIETLVEGHVMHDTMEITMGTKPTKIAEAAITNELVTTTAATITTLTMTASATAASTTTLTMTAATTTALATTTAETKPMTATTTTVMTTAMPATTTAGTTTTEAITTGSTATTTIAETKTLSATTTTAISPTTSAVTTATSAMITAPTEEIKSTKTAITPITTATISDTRQAEIHRTKTQTTTKTTSLDKEEKGSDHVCFDDSNSIEITMYLKGHKNMNEIIVTWHNR